MEKNHQQPTAPQNDSGRKAFLFYTNWYDDSMISLTTEEQAEFILIIVRYGAKGIVPGEETSPTLRTMFGLIRNAIDTDLQKYETISEINREKAKKSAEKRRSKVKKAAPAELTQNEQVQAIEPILNTQHSILNTQNSTLDTQNSVPEKKEGSKEALPQKSEIEAYWAEHKMKSNWEEFFDFYDRNGWLNQRGEQMRSWKYAAHFWEEKYRRDVLPARLREAAVDAQERRSAEAAEAQRIREEKRRAAMAEAAEREAQAVSREQGLYMYRRALELAKGDKPEAMGLLQRANTEPDIFRLLSAGYGQG